MAKYPQQIAFILDNITEPSLIAAGLPPHVQPVVIDARGDALDAIVAVLAGFSDLEAIHLFSHGEAGLIDLGATRLDAAAVAARSGDLSALGRSLAAGGDLLLYGCEVARGAAGAQFLAELAKVTGCNIAASTELTGCADRGGRWELDAQIGSVGTEIVAVETYPEVLVVTQSQAALTNATSFHRPTTPNYSHVYSAAELSGLEASSFNYGAASFVPSQTGSYTFSVSQTAMDAWMAIYQGSFDPTQPLANLLYANDDSSSNELPYIPNVQLTAGTTYIVVMTSFNPSQVGTYTFSISGPAAGTFNDPNATLANTLPDSPTITEDATATVIQDLWVSDPANGTVTVALTVTHGTIAIDATTVGSGGGAGVTITSGASGQSAFTISGSLTDVNAALATVAFTPTADYFGSAALGITTSNGTAALNDSVAINITSVNDAPTITGPNSVPTVTVGQATDLPDYVVADADGDQLTVTLTASNGTIGGLTDADPNTAGIQLQGTAAQITAALAAATFTATQNGSASIAVSIDDGIASPVNETLPITAQGGSNTVTPAEPGSGPVTDIRTIDGLNVDFSFLSYEDGSSSQIVKIPLVTVDRVDQTGNAVADIPLLTDVDGTRLLLVQVPTGESLDVVVPRLPETVTSGLSTLVREIKAHTVSGSADQTALTGGGINYLKQLPAASNIAVTTVNLPASHSGLSSQPLTFIASDKVTSAIVIDARATDGKTVVKLDGIDFASLSGDVTVKGGDGDEVIWGDSGNQTVSLGGGNDFFSGGGGTDTVVYDQGFGEARVTLNRAGQWVVKTATGTDTLESVEVVKLGNATLSLEAVETHGPSGSVYRLYQGALGRFADTGGLAYWVGEIDKGARDLVSTARDFMLSSEFQKAFGDTTTMTDSAFLTLLYSNILDRAPDAAGLAYWAGELARGVERERVLVSMSESVEHSGIIGADGNDVPLWHL